MWIKPEGYLSKFQYVEIGHYVEYNDKANVIREKDGDLPVFVRWDDLQPYIDRWNNTGIYTSIFRYSSPSLDAAVRLGPLYFDVDSDDAQQALLDARSIVRYLKGHVPTSAIEIYFSGKKGFHIECQPVALGITPTPNPADVYRFIANCIKDELSLSTLDFSVYEPRRMWRLPYSVHQSTGLYKLPLTSEELFQYDIEKIKDLAKIPRIIEVQPQEFNLKANEWYRQFTYKIEEAKQNRNITKQSVIERFQSHGSGHIVEHEKEFDPIRLFEGCPAIIELWNKAETKHDLEHEERLFLCSLLTYTDEAIEYLHAILSNCSDYSFERSQSHIEDWMRRREMGIGGRPYTCERATSAGISCTGCDKLEPKPKYERINGKLYPTNETTNPSPVRYAYSRKTES